MSDQITERNLKLKSGRIASTSMPMTEDEKRRQLRGIEKQYFGREDIDRISGWKLGAAVVCAVLMIVGVITVVLEVIFQ